MVALGIRVPNPLKRTMTTLQIAQFIFGSSYAAAHLFLKYDIPIKSTYKIFHPISSISSVASSTISEMSTAVTAVAASPSASLASRFMRFLYRAAGDEGVAENIRDQQGQYLAPEVRSAVEHVQEKFREETRSRTEYTTIDCVDTSGEVWAILINLFYLLPLTYLFMRFFYRAYLARTSPSSSAQDKRRAARQSTVDAAREVNGKFDKAGQKVERALSNATSKADAQAFKKDRKDVRDGSYKTVKDKQRRVSDRVHDFEERAKEMKDKVSEAIEGAKKDTPVKSKGQDQGSSGSPSKAKSTAADDLHDLAQNVKNTGKGEKSGQLDSKHDNSSTPNRSERAGATTNDSPESDDSGADVDASSPGRTDRAEGQQSQDASPQKKKKKKNKKKKSGAGNLADSAASLGGDGGNTVMDSPAAGTYAQTQS